LDSVGPESKNDKSIPSSSGVVAKEWLLFSGMALSPPEEDEVEGRLIELALTLGSSVAETLGDGVGAALGDGVGPTLGDGVGADLGDGVGPTLGDGVGPTLGDGVGPTLGDGVGPTLGDGVGPFAMTPFFAIGNGGGIA
jgi:hypothetical protein